MAVVYNITGPAPQKNTANVIVENFCERLPGISLVVTIPLAFVVASIICGNLILILHWCRNQQPNARPVHVPTVCFASGNLLNTVILMFIQLYFTLSKDYFCRIVGITQHFQLVVLTFFCVHLFIATIRFCIIMFKPSFELSDSVPSPHVRTSLIVIWFQSTSHCFSVLITLFITNHTPGALNLLTFCLILSVPVLTILLFVLSQVIRHFRQIRRYREWSGETVSFSHHRNQQCVVFKWSLMTACTVLVFWLPFWTKNVFDYLQDPNASLQAFDNYSWIVIDILLLSNSLVIHLI